jgi:bifunctional DNA-binding transcriptional regulator/antitoxin component of YhaV-PrlF toxin-antitoxin module
MSTITSMLSRDESCGVIDRIAASFGVHGETRRKWRWRGKVPGRWHLPILQKAKAEGLELNPDALSDFRPETRATRSRRGPEAGKPPARPRRGHHVRIEAGGRLTIPRALLEDLDLSEGDPVVLEVEEGELRLLSQKRVIAEIQALVRQYVPEGVSLTDELIAERRREAELE